MTSVNSTKSIPIQKLILSLQIDDVGRTVSDKLGMLMSGLKPDFTGLPYVVRNNISVLTTQIKEIIANVEERGIVVERFKAPKKVVATKKITKKVAVEIETTQEIEDVIKQLGWEITYVCAADCDFLIVEDKNKLQQEDWYKELGVKIMSLKQIKLLFL